MTAKKCMPPFEVRKKKPDPKFPQFCVFMGVPKVGKSTVLSVLPNTFFLDLEDGKGYEDIEVHETSLLRSIGTKDKMHESIKWFFSKDNIQYEILVIDHLRELTEYFYKEICEQYKVSNIRLANGGFGVGTDELKVKVRKFFTVIRTALAKHPKKRVFIPAHATTKNNETRLDVNGQNEELIFSLVDAIGFMSRDVVNPKIMNISFENGHNMDIGLRNKFLSAYTGKLDWDILFELGEGKQVVEEQVKKTA